MSRDPFEEADAEAIREALAAKPGSWVCALCHTVFGAEVKGYEPTSGTAPATLTLIDADQRLCGECFLVLSTPPPNWPGRKAT